MVGMARNSLAIITAFWLTLTPTLCAAGILTHPCKCSAGVSECGACCESEEASCNCVDETCSHDGCENDPCQVGLAAKSEGNKKLELSVAPLQEVAFATLRAFEEFAIRKAGPPHEFFGRPGSKKNLPYHLSDTPLLV